MRVAYGSSSLRFTRHESHDDLEAFVRSPVCQGLLLGENAETYLGFFGMEVRAEFDDAVSRIGIITETEVTVPQVVPLAENGKLVVGFDTNVVFVDVPSLEHRVHRLAGPFFCFFAFDSLVIGIHELGATGFNADTGDPLWAADCDVVERARLSNGVLSLKSLEGPEIRVNPHDGGSILRSV